MDLNNSDNNVASSWQNIVSSAIIIVVGVRLHIQSVSLFEMGVTKSPMLAPDAASVIFVFSILCILSKLRPYWPRAFRRPPVVLLFSAELPAALCATEFLMRQVWVPSVVLLDLACRFFSGYIGVNWTGSHDFFLARLLLAFIMFLTMIDMIGVRKWFHQSLQTKSEILYDDESIFEDADPFERCTSNYPLEISRKPVAVGTLPNVPLSNLLEKRRKGNAK